MSISMDVEAYNTGLHYETMIHWLQEHGAYVPTEDEMPRIGFVVYSSHYPLAMAFLRRVEGDIAQLDGLVTNPQAKSEERNEAIWRAIEEIIKACRALSIKHVMSFSTDFSIIERSSRHGFRKHDKAILMTLEVD